MKKLNITYLEKMISKVLKENLGEKAETLVSKIKSSIKENSEENLLKSYQLNTFLSDKYVTISQTNETLRDCIKGINNKHRKI